MRHGPTNQAQVFKWESAGKWVESRDLQVDLQGSCKSSQAVKQVTEQRWEHPGLQEGPFCQFHIGRGYWLQEMLLNLT